jgi:hypothetical protein
MKRSLLFLACLALCAGAGAKLPEPTPEAKAKAELTKAENAHKDKVAAYQTCLAQSTAAKRYLASAAGKDKKAAETPPCADPGPFVAPVPPPVAVVAPAPAPAAAAAAPASAKK